jgi:periplasmic protein TonB
VTTARACSAPAARGDRGLLVWLVPASVVLHVAAIGAAPAARAAHHLTRAPVVIELAEPPPPLPEPQPEPEKASRAEPEAPAPARVVPVAAAGRAPRGPVDPLAATSPEARSGDAPADFTSTIMSNDGAAGAPPRSGASSGAGAEASAAAGPRVPRLPAGPRVVAASELARPPRAPGLDRALERHYPPEARRSGISGSAVLRVQILSDGRVGAVRRLSQSYEGFGAACEATVREATWDPPTDREGSRVATEITYTCRFEVRS